MKVLSIFLVFFFFNLGCFSQELADIPELKLPQTFDKIYFSKFEVPKNYIPVSSEFMEEHSVGNPLQSDNYCLGKITLDKKRSILVIYEINDPRAFVSYHLSIVNGKKDPVTGRPQAVSFMKGTIERAGKNIIGHRKIVDLGYEDGKRTETRSTQSYVITKKGVISYGDIKVVSKKVLD